jgi:hypothetical protein
MAQIPTDDEVKAAQAEASRKIEEKRQLQAQEGKKFEVPEDGHAAGVIPEDVWKGIK